MKENIIRVISNRTVIMSFFVVCAFVASLQSLTSTKTYYEGGKTYNGYNNYSIFEKSFEHLKNNQDLYTLYPEEHWDFYKYTPTFSVFFGLFNVFPDWLGLCLWNLLNALLLLSAVYYLPKLSLFEKGLMLLLVIFELVTSMQNEQCNALMAGLFIFSFGLLEKNKTALAVLCITLTVFIKPFGIVGFALFLLYPKKGLAALWALGFSVLLFLLPLLFVDCVQYLKLFNSYFVLLANDYTTNAMFMDKGPTYGFSVMGWLHTWFNVGAINKYVVFTGILIFLLPFLRFKSYSTFMFRYLLLCCILIWIVIFNHKAESPTYILAMSGVALWFLKAEKSLFNIILFVSAVVLTSLSPTDLFPKYLRDHFVIPYTLKVLPCILIWLKIIFDMLNLKNKEHEPNPLPNH